jgi:hypothetical protein
VEEVGDTSVGCEERWGEGSGRCLGIWPLSLPAACGLGGLLWLTPVLCLNNHTAHLLCGGMQGKLLVGVSRQGLAQERGAKHSKNEGVE